MTNEVKLIGKMARDGKLLQTKNGNDMCLFTVYAERNGGDKMFYDYIPCLAWGEKAKVISRLHQDERIAFTGYITSSSYPDKSDPDKKKKINKTEVVVGKFIEDEMTIPPENTTFNDMADPKPEEIPF